MRLRRLQGLQRTDDFAQQVGGDLGVDHRGVEFLVAEQRLDDADVDLLLEQVGREAVAKRVHRHPLVDAGRQGGGLNSAIELARAQRLDRVEAREQPAAI